MENKIYWDNLCIEITRKCNMRCAHCMRGEPQDFNMNEKYVEEIFKNTAYIGVIHLVGGEPSLNIEGIQKILELAKKYKVMILNYDLITNGKEIPDEFINVAKNWTDYCSLFNPDQQPGLYITIDPFHEEISSENIKKITDNNFGKIRLDRYKPKNKEDIFIDGTKSNYILDCGRAKTLNGYKKLPWNIKADPPLVYKHNNNYYVQNSKIAISCTGNILKHTSYEWANEEKAKLCYYTELMDIFEQIAISPPEHMTFFNVFKDGRDKR